MPSCVVNISSVCVAIEIISVPIVIKYGSNPSLVRYPPIDIFSLLSILALADNGFSISCNTVLNWEDSKVPLTYNCKLLPDF